ncbi:GATOR2 complex protein MIOS-like isoform X2 [Rhopilema esculentum]|uniref:GATOR2 complex protein MIOS-like isoform X2 n=1 Tax=Rhopilema esculentum TaxID=499914 RepID=UPI0031E45B33
MAAKSWEVIWSPHNPNEFIRYCNDIFLYKIISEEENLQKPSSSKHQMMKLSDDMSGTVVAVNSEVSAIKEVSWCRRPDAQHLLAVGQSNGHVVLANVGHEISGTGSHLLGVELTPKSDRTCTDLAWNPVEHNLLAVALDKVRDDHSLLVWDVESAPVSMGTKSMQGRHSRSDGSSIMTPTQKNGLKESTVSLAWFPRHPKTLVAGQGQKFLRVYDLRDSGKLVSFGVTNCKAMNGVCVDPFSEHRFASFAETAQGPVLVWDTRNLKEPVVTINQASQTKQISRIGWCPTRSHMLAVLQRNSPVIKLSDLIHLPTEQSMPFPSVMDEESESLIMERKIQPSKGALSSFSWHPTKENVMLSANATGNVNYTKIYERITMSWSSGNGLVWGCGKEMLACKENNEESFKDFKDISSIMKERAIRGYGEKSVMKDLEKLREILNDPFLIKLWTWLKHVRKPKDQDTRKGRRFYGVRSIIKGEMNMSGKCEKGQQEESSKGGSQYAASPYFSEDRKLALQLCLWDFSGSSLTEHLTKLERAGEYERAAATALFNNQMRLAINILSGRNTRENKSDNGPREGRPSQDSPMNLVAMALSGYSTEKRSLWREMCGALSPQLKNPYLRAVFAFLTQEDDNFNSILREPGIHLEDRVAFACKYLPDSTLVTFIDSLTATLVEEGCLEGLLLTGLTSDGLNLLEKYVTKTSDVQTASLIIVNTKVSETLRDPRVICWLDSYRDILDTWRLWHQRAKLDAFIYGAESGKKVPHQICISCNYCGKPVSANLFSSGGMFRSSRYAGMSSSKPKVMACPSCRRPLPRCAVCLINMGTSSSHMQRQTGTKPKTDFQHNPFDNWFTWCQNCKHGGHAVHLIDWFKEETECPVTGCPCRCNSQDGVCQLSNKEVQNTNE